MTALVGQVVDGAGFGTVAGGCRPPTPGELAGLPAFDPGVLRLAPLRTMALALAVPGSRPNWVQRYLANYQSAGQGGTGTCTGCARNACHMASALNYQGQVTAQLSWGFSYYTATKDATFTKGSSVSRVVGQGQLYGACADEFYSQGYVLAKFNAWPGHVFGTDELPQPPAYADALTRKIVRWTRIASSGPDMELVYATLDSGRAIAFGIGNHASCLLDYSPDRAWISAVDSELGMTDIGNGPGIRVFHRDAIHANAYDLCTIEEVLIGSGTFPPPGVNTMTRANIIAQATALPEGPCTQAAKDALIMECQQLVTQAATAQSITAFTATPASIPAGSAVTIAWATLNATAVKLNGVTVAVTGSLQFTPAANAIYILTVSGPAPDVTQQLQVTVTQPVPGGGAAAAFTGVNTSAKGNWKGVYGADGYLVVMDAAGIPGYATVAPSGKSDFKWADATADVRALQRATSGRIAACWYSSTKFDVAVGISGSSPRRVALYFLDWDSGNRAVRVDALDAVTQQVLATATVNSYQQGIYAVFDLTGNVILRVTNIAGSWTNATLSGIFIG